MLTGKEMRDCTPSQDLYAVRLVLNMNHLIIDSKGKLLHSQDTGALESGDHHDRDKVLTFLKKWAPKKGS